MDKSRELLDEYNLLVECRSAQSQSFARVVSFLPCHKASIRKKHVTLFKANCVKISHPMLEICHESRCSYFTCIEYAPSNGTDVHAKHVCDMFPVFLCSQLDKEICQCLFSDFVWNDCIDRKTEQRLAGMIYVDNSLAHFPFLLTNRKELAHKIISKTSYAANVKHAGQPGETYVSTIGDQYNVNRRKKTAAKTSPARDIFCLYVYEREERQRGHKFALSSDDRLIYRNPKGQDADRVNEPPNFEVNQRHIDYDNIANGFRMLYKNNIAIDSLKNKLIKSAVNMLDEGLDLAFLNPVRAQIIFQRGRLEFFASSKISFTKPSSRSAKSAATTGNAYATSNRPTYVDTVQPSSSDAEYGPPPAKRARRGPVAKAGSTDGSVSAMPKKASAKRKRQASPDGVSKKISACAKRQKKNGGDGFSDTSDGSFCYRKLEPNQIGLNVPGCLNVLRPSPINVHRSNVPTDIEWIMCIADRSFSIEAPNRWMTMMPDVTVSNRRHLGICVSVNKLLNMLLACGLIKRRPSGFFNGEELSSAMCIFVLGGLITPYIVDTNKFEKMFAVIKAQSPFTEIYRTSTTVLITNREALPFLWAKYI